MADLQITISESVVINGSDRGSTNTLTTTGINNTFQRTLTAAHSNITTIAEFATANHTSESAIDLNDVRYCRVTNLDDAEELIVGIILFGLLVYGIITDFDDGSGYDKFN